MSAILMYHDVARTVVNPLLQVTPQSLEKHLTWIREAGYRIAPLAELLGYGRVSSPSQEIEDLVAITFDDGYAGVALSARLFQSDSEKPSLFVCPGMVGRVNAWASTAGFSSRLLDREGLIALMHEGWEIQCHGWDHGTFSGKSERALAAELDRCLAWFTDILRVRPAVIAYPYGHVDARIIRVAARRFSFGLAVDVLPELPHLFAIPRITVVDHMTRPWLLSQISEKRLRLSQFVRRAQ